MLRSSSMLITRARSVRNVSKLPFRFTFDLLIDSVDKIAITGPVVLVWERSSTKVISTKSVTVDRNSRKANFGNEQLTNEITLFKSSPQDKRFQDKVVKLAIKGGNSDGKTLGKIHLNLADHAELPAGSKKISAELNNGSVLIATVQCQFISMGNSNNSTSSGKSSMRNKVFQSSNTNANKTSDESDLDSTDVESESGSNLKSKLGKFSSKRGIGNFRKGRNSEAFTNVSLESSDTASSSNTSPTNNNSCNSGNLEKLKRENVKLKKQLEEMEKSFNCNSNGAGNSHKLLEENKSLKREIENLKDSLKRDPEFHELVAQLKETKMGLALLQLEKDQLALQVMNQRDSPKTV